MQYPSGRQTLCLLPSKFNKKLWVKRGGFLLVEECKETGEGSGPGQAKVTGTILAVLYADQIRQLKKMPGVWPAEFVAADVSSKQAVLDMGKRRQRQTVTA